MPDTSIRRSTAGLCVAALALVAAGGVGVAHASTLKVDGGVIQSFTYPVDIDAPDPDPVMRTVTVEARGYNSGNNQPVRDEQERFEVTDGASYVLSWSGGTVVDCSSVGHDLAPGEVEGIDGPFVADADVTHVFCYQTGNGKIHLEIVEPEADRVARSSAAESVTVESTAPEPASAIPTEEPDPTPTDVQEEDVQEEPDQPLEEVEAEADHEQAPTPTLSDGPGTGG